MLTGKLRTVFATITLRATLVVYAVSAYSAVTVSKAACVTQTEVVLFAQTPEIVQQTPEIVQQTPEIVQQTPITDELTGFKFPDTVSMGAQKYLEEAYNQAYSVSKDTVYPDPFMAMSLAVVELPVADDEVFRIPLVYQDTLTKALDTSGGDYAEAIKYSYDATLSYEKYACVGPLQMATGWVSSTPRNPTLWQESCQMFYEDAELAIPGMTVFAEKCGIEVNDTFLRTLSAMRHNVGTLSDWSKADPDSSTGRSFIPFTSKRAVFKWNEAVASNPAQDAIKKASYKAYLDYLTTGNYENQGIDWREIADITGYAQSNITSDKQWWRPLYSVRFWYNYYQLRLLYGVDTAETLGVVQD